MLARAEDGWELWWDESGDPGLDPDAAPLLLIMGLGYPSAMWWRWLPELSATHRVIRFDNRGVGRTGVAPGPYTIEQLAADAVVVLDAAGVEAAHVIGASMGGMIAQELALSHPGRVESLVLACTGPGGAEQVPPEPEALEMAAARATVSPEEAAEMSRQRIEEDLAVRAAEPTDPEGYTNQLLAVVGHGGSASRLEDLTVPTLVVHGMDDRLVPPDNGRFLAKAIPGAQLVLLEDASHILFTDQPERSLDAVTSFIAGPGDARRSRGVRRTSTSR